MRLKNIKIDGINKDKIVGLLKFLKLGMLVLIVFKNYFIVKMIVNFFSILIGNFCKKFVRRINNVK